MKPFVQGFACTVLCLAVCGCGGSQSRVWRGPRIRSTGESIYAPPVDPYYAAPPLIERAPLEQIAPPVRPGDLEPLPTPAIRLQEELLPPPPAEDEESVQFILPVPPSSMPNALDPVDSRPILEQSSAERPMRRDRSEDLGEGKIALRMQGHSTYAASQPARLLCIEPEEKTDLPTGLMQVQYVPLLAPVPAL